MTKEYEYLKSRLSSISSSFDSLIPKDPLEQTDEKAQNIIKSYILLCHAEFEKYFEDVAWDIIKKAKDEFDTKQQTSLPLLNLSLMLKKEFNNNETANERLDKLFSNFRALIEGNHGIRKANINDMFAPLGIPINIMSDTYIESLESFGKKRGQIAHNVKESIITTYNFSDEKAMINRLLNETLEEIDKRAENFI